MDKKTQVSISKRLQVAVCVCWLLCSGTGGVFFVKGFDGSINSMTKHKIY